LGFSSLIVGIHFYPSSDGLISPWWVLLGYSFETMAELCIAPIGLSTATKLAPKRIASTIISFWFLAIAFGNYLAGTIAQRACIPEEISKTQPSAFLPIYESAFIKIALVSFGLGLTLLLVYPFIKRFFKEKA
jgi:POT family proton-dependent oligopeptide transporter